MSGKQTRKRDRAEYRRTEPSPVERPEPDDAIDPGVEGAGDSSRMVQPPAPPTPSKAPAVACEHVIARTVVVKGKYFRRCDICGETWLIESRG